MLIATIDGRVAVSTSRTGGGGDAANVGAGTPRVGATTTGAGGAATAVAAAGAGAIGAGATGMGCGNGECHIAGGSSCPPTTRPNSGTDGRFRRGNTMGGRTSDGVLAPRSTSTCSGVGVVRAIFVIHGRYPALRRSMHRIARRDSARQWSTHHDDPPMRHVAELLVEVPHGDVVLVVQAGALDAPPVTTRAGCQLPARGAARRCARSRDRSAGRSA